MLRKVAATPFGSMRLDPAVAISQLQEAAHLQSSVVIGYVDPAGVATQRVVAPINVRGGQLTAYDPASGRVREFAIHRVTSVVSADDGSSPDTASSQRPLREYVCVTTALSAASSSECRIPRWAIAAARMAAADDRAVAAVALVVAVGWRSRRWRLMWVPVAIAVGLILAALRRTAYIDSQGLAGDPRAVVAVDLGGPHGYALAVAVLGWRGSQWSAVARCHCVAVLVCLLSAGACAESVGWLLSEPVPGGVGAS